MLLIFYLISCYYCFLNCSFYLEHYRIELEVTDEFIILGCDGIWDCLTNENAVNFVRERIDHKKPTEIGVELLDTIISDDPRATQGIGGDNMTLMIIDLQPHRRSYRSTATAPIKS